MIFSWKFSLMAKTSYSKPPRLIPVPRKDRLFDDFFRNMITTTVRIERLFDVPNFHETVFGKFCSGYEEDLTTPKEKLRSIRAWRLLSELYDYAVEGIDRTGQNDSVTEDTSSLVIDAGEVIALLRGEEEQASPEWDDIVMMGDGRFALEDGMSIDVERLALLANVDVRTVRNAVSSGALETNTHEDKFILNESARVWLMSRKGYKPTVIAGDQKIDIANIHGPDRFGAFLRQRHEERRQAQPPEGAATIDPLLDAYPGLTPAILAEVEAGVFRVPLSLVWPLADYYGVARHELLECVMRVFFPDELAALRDTTKRGLPGLRAAISEEIKQGGV
jgi:hypothetical protein